MERHRLRSIQVLLAMSMAGYLAYFSETKHSPYAFLRTNSYPETTVSRSRKLLNVHDTELIDKTAIDDENARRANCQFVYVLGVEGVGHHGFTPIISKLVKHQLDPHTNMKYVVENPESPLVQKAIYGRKAVGRPIDDPELIQELLSAVCPNDGRKHILPLGTSFPSKSFNDGYYPVSRQRDWAHMSMQEIALSETALKHPINLRAFHRTYSKYVDVKYVALSSPFLETVVTHQGFDGGPEQHMNVLSGYLLLLRNFLDWTDATAVSSATKDNINSKKKKANKKLWTLVCMEQLEEKFHNGDMASVTSTRSDVVSNLAHFLEWPQDRCDDCFDHWRDRNDDRAMAERKLVGRGTREGKPHIMELVKMKMEVLDDVWPPPPTTVKRQKQCML